MISTLEKLQKKFPEKTALITGGASGIGRDMAICLLADGWTVGVVDKDCDALARLSRLGLGRVGEGKLHGYCIDAADYPAMSHSVTRFLVAEGSISLLVNAVGIGASGEFEALDIDDWRRVIDVNVLGVVNACHAVLPSMKGRSSGHICTIASAAAYHSLAQLSAYNMTKAAMVSMTETLRAELSDYGIEASVMISAFYRSNIARFTLGGQRAQKRAQGLVQLSSMSSADAAWATLRGIAGGRTYLLVGMQARFVYFIKRHFPNFFNRLAPWIAKKAFAKADAEL